MPTTILTNDANYSDTFTGGVPGTERYTNSAGSATFNFIGLTAGLEYAIAFAWVEFTNRVTNTAWSVAGTSGAPAGTINQQLAPSGFTSGGNNYQWFNQKFVPTATTLTLTIAFPGSPSPAGNYTEVVAAYLDLVANVTPIFTVSNGDVNTGATWLFGAKPSGTVFGSIKHTMTEAAAWTVGDGTTGTVLACSSGTLAISGATLTIRGKSSWGQAGTVTKRLEITNSGSTPGGIELDCDAGAPDITLQSDTQIKITGTSSARCFLRTKSGSTGSHGTLDGGTFLRTYFDFAYADLTRLGDGTHDNGFSTSGSAGDPIRTANLAYCVIDTCGRFAIGAEDNTTCSITYTRWKNCQHANFMFIISGSAALTAGMREFKFCSVDSSTMAYFPSPWDWTIDDNVFMGGYDAESADPHKPASWARNFIAHEGPHSDFTNLVHADPVDCYFYARATRGHFIYYPPNNTVVSGCVFENLAAATRSMLQSSGGATDESMTVLNCINISGDVMGQFDSPTATSPKRTYRIEHNNLRLPDNIPGFYFGLSVGQKVNTITSFKSNYLYRASGPVGNNFALSNLDPSPVECLLSANADYNGWHNLALSNNFSGNSHGTIYDTPMPTGTAPGSHDLANADAQLVAPTRCLETWGASLGSANVAETLAHLHAQFDPTDADYNAAYTTVALNIFVKNGNKPQNIAFKDAGHDGMTIGAMPFQASGGAIIGGGFGIGSLVGE